MASTSNSSSSVVDVTVTYVAPDARYIPNHSQPSVLTWYSNGRISTSVVYYPESHWQSVRGIMHRPAINNYFPRTN